MKDRFQALAKRILEVEDECDNTHEQNHTVCRACWKAGLRYKTAWWRKKMKTRKSDPRDRRIVLYDGYNEQLHARKGVKAAKLPVKIEPRSNGIFLMPKGYGDCVSKDGFGTPVQIEYYNGELRVLVWSDINQEDPTYIISMEKARESKRKTGQMGEQHTVRV